MFLKTVALIYLACDLIVIGTGCEVLLGLLGGDLRNKWVAVFLKLALVTSILGLLFPFPSRVLTAKALLSMAEVYLCAVAIYARPRVQRARVWQSILTWSLSLTLYVSILVPVLQYLAYLPWFNYRVHAELRAPFVFISLLFLLVFLLLAAVAARRIRPRLGLTDQYPPPAPHHSPTQFHRAAGADSVHLIH